MPAKAKHQTTEPGIVSSVYLPNGIRKIPAGIEMNERTTGTTRPISTAESSCLSNQRSARAEPLGPEV